MRYDICSYFDTVIELQIDRKRTILIAFNWSQKSYGQLHFTISDTTTKRMFDGSFWYQCSIFANVLSAPDSIKFQTVYMLNDILEQLWKSVDTLTYERRLPLLPFFKDCSSRTKENDSEWRGNWNFDSNYKISIIYNKKKGRRIPNEV